MRWISKKLINRLLILTESMSIGTEYSCFFAITMIVLDDHECLLSLIRYECIINAIVLVNSTKNQTIH